MGTSAIDSVILRSFVLHDVQALFGGRVLWAAEDRSGVLQMVGRGMWERRYHLILTEDEWAEVERLAGEHRLFTLTTIERPGLPDEARPALTLTPRSGDSVRIQKWAGDTHPDFDALYEFLLTLCRPESMIVYEGPFHWDWRPNGFERPR